MTAHHRQTGWPEKLNAFFEVARGKKFIRGKWDCALFAVAGVKEMTGHDYGSEFRAKYSTRDGAVQILREKGYPDLLSITNATLGEPLRSVLMAQRGDVVGFLTGDGYALGLVDLTGTRFYAVGPKKLEHIPLTQAQFAWRI